MDQPNNTLRLLLTNQLKELDAISNFLDDLTVSGRIPPGITMTLNLVLEEAFTNIVQYAYADKESHDIEILFCFEHDRLRITIIDDGIPYDPTAREDPDTTLEAEERPIGGLGIFLIRQMMDSVSYHRIDQKNRLEMEKRMVH